MRWLISTVLAICKFLYGISGVTLVVMMLLTVSDVVLRMVGRPIEGVYELVGYFSSIVVGFALPFTTWTKGHVYMEFLVDRFPVRTKKVASVLTRIIGIALFAFVAYNLADVGRVLYDTGEVSPTLQLPVYPFAWAVAVCCCMMCLTLVCDILRMRGGEYE
jgi:TRAP-type C4-dicarboxylate transport system permease small subunit